MIPRIKFDPKQAAREFADFQRKLVRGSELLSKVKDRDVQIGSTPKTLVFQTDKITLHHYKPTAKTTIKTPVLVIYGLVGTLHDGRPAGRPLAGPQPAGAGRGRLCRRLGQREPRRPLADARRLHRRLPERVRRLHPSSRGIDQVTLLGICEGGVFTLCYAALYPEKVKNLILTITPVDFHADSGRTARITASSTCGRAA